MDKKTSKFLEENSRKFSLATVESLSSFEFVKQKTRMVPYSYAKENKVLPLEIKDDKLLVACANPLALEALEELAIFTSLPIEEYLTETAALDKAIESCYHQQDASNTSNINVRKEQSAFAVLEEGYDLLETQSESVVIRLLNNILLEGIGQKASDIHFEPQEKDLSVRFRIDGVLHKRQNISKEYISEVITRVKVMASLDVAERRLPQDGRIKLRIGGRQIDFRVSTIPTAYGERVVLRILDKSNVNLGLANLGMKDKILESFQKLIRLTEGIILVTGPTGSGKTTTLYSALSELPSSQINIMTIEDPVEYKLEGMAQISVNSKINLGFAQGLRHILRQDPDVIMIGEIRDQETAEIAVQASLTGHLVLSTLHTNDAPSAIPRLVDMGIEPYLLSSSVLGIVAQRLLRKICPDCKQSYTPTGEELLELGIKKTVLPNKKLYKGSGCNSCFGSGYQGRQPIYEFMLVNEAIKKQITHSVDAKSLRDVAVAQGLSTLREEGLKLIINGLTTSEEFLRVCRDVESLQ